MLASLPPRPVDADAFVAYAEEALPKLEAAALSNPSDAVLLRARSRLRKSVSRGPSQEPDHIVLPEIFPADPLELYRLGLDAGDRRTARAYFLQSAEQASDFAWPHLELAESYRRDGDYEQAERHAREMIALCPRAIEGYSVYARIDGAGDPARQAARVYRRLVEQAAPDVQAQNRRLLWDWESNLADDLDHYQGQLAAEVAALEAAADDSRATAFLLKRGYEMVGDWESVRRLSARAWDRAEPRPIEIYNQELSRFQRIRGASDLSTSPAAREAYWRQLLAASDSWIERWPLDTFAWLDRLRAIIELDEVSPALVESTADGALRANAQPSAVRYQGGYIAALVVRAYLKHGVRLDQAEETLQRAGEQISNRQRTDPLALTLLSLRAQLAERRHDLAHWEEALDALAAALGERPATTDRERLSRWAPGVRDLALSRARLAVARADREAAWEHAARALDVRPISEGRDSHPQNAEAVAEVRGLWKTSGRLEDEWASWLAERPGTLIPSARRASVSWFEANEPLPWSDLPGAAGVPRLIVVWRLQAGSHLPALRDLERRVRAEPGLELAVVSPETSRLALRSSLREQGMHLPVRRVRHEEINRVSRNVHGPQVWLVDAEGSVRRIARFRPVGEEWTAIVLAAARKLPATR